MAHNSQELLSVWRYSTYNAQKMPVYYLGLLSAWVKAWAYLTALILCVRLIGHHVLWTFYKPLEFELCVHMFIYVHPKFDH